jgi:hypothetical protein
MIDCELRWDHTLVEYDNGNGEWVEIVSYDGTHSLVATHHIRPNKAATKLRFRFTSDVSWSDQDGLVDTDGACIFDSISVSDGTGLIDFENFESYAVGSTKAGLWTSVPSGRAFGAYSGLATNLIDRDPCARNISTQIVFWKNHPYPIESGDYPGLYVTPFCLGEGGIEAPCQDELVVSPVIDLGSYSTACDEIQDAGIPEGSLYGLGGYDIRFSAYRDLPLENLVFYQWKIRGVVNGCPQSWQTKPQVGIGWGYREQFLQVSHEIAEMIEYDSIQVACGVIDMCSEWYELYGTCAEHTPAPYIDNVRLYRYGQAGPQWSYYGSDLFQDTFPVDENDMESVCRADAGVDKCYLDQCDRVHAGDSAVVWCDSPTAGGLEWTPDWDARVYCHVNVRYIGPDSKPDIFGPALEGSWGSYVSDDGEWTTLICPEAPQTVQFPYPKFCIDLNDSILTRGYMIEYYFEAWDLDGLSSTLPPTARHPDGDRFEFTCLPTGNSDALYVDDFNNKGTFEGMSQTYFDLVFQALEPDGGHAPDRYDVNGPEIFMRNRGSGLESRATVRQLAEAYKDIFWDCGLEYSVTINEGTSRSENSDDAQLLIDWMRTSGHRTGLWVLGDNVADDLSQSEAPSALELTAGLCGIELESRSLFELTGGGDGGITSPLVIGVEGSPFEDFSYYVDGGCPTVVDFDVLDLTGPGQIGMRYTGYTQGPPWACIYTDQVNDHGYPMRTVWTGHSIIHVRDTEPDESARTRLASLVYGFFGRATSGVTVAEIPSAMSLSRNFPNPFNPSTRIKFSLSRRSHVRLLIYDVSGRLVRVLIDETRQAGTYGTAWNGKTEKGHQAASGVYFCRMEAADYKRSMKMVLLR